MSAQSLQWCLTLCDPMDCSLPGSSVHGILQARILDWVAIPSSRGSNPALLHCRQDRLPSEPPGKPPSRVGWVAQGHGTAWKRTLPMSWHCLWGVHSPNPALRTVQLCSLEPLPVRSQLWASVGSLLKPRRTAEHHLGSAGAKMTWGWHAGTRKNTQRTWLLS